MKFSEVEPNTDKSISAPNTDKSISAPNSDISISAPNSDKSIGITEIQITDIYTSDNVLNMNNDINNIRSVDTCLIDCTTNNVTNYKYHLDSISPKKVTNTGDRDSSSLKNITNSYNTNVNGVDSGSNIYNIMNNNHDFDSCLSTPIDDDNNEIMYIKSSIGDTTANTTDINNISTNTTSKNDKNDINNSRKNINMTFFKNKKDIMNSSKSKQIIFL